MATVNTRVRRLRVGDGVLTCNLESSNKQSPRYEVRLDGWKDWRETEAAVRLGPLDPGSRTFEARSFSKAGAPDPSPAHRSILVEYPEPEPEPPSEFRVERRLLTPADWNSRLIEGFDGASIAADGDRTRYWLPGPQTASGGRVETQTYWGVEGMRCSYDYSFLIPALTRLSDAYPGSPKNIITQHHGDQNAGYTGGVSVYPDGTVSLRVKGGDEFGMQGSHPYSYEAELPFGEFQDDTEHHVRLEIFWHRSHGDARARLDDGRWEALSAVPTWPLGNSDGVPTTKIMYRHGWYPQGGKVLGDMDIRFGPLELGVAD